MAEVRPPAPLAQRSAGDEGVPTPRSSFVGRADDVAAVAATLRRASVRLLTLTGPGGVGKTRLALAAAAELAATFPDGVRFVPLASIRDANLVAAAIAETLGVQETSDRALPAAIAMSLRHRSLLLVLDNFEHVSAAAPLVADLLDASPGLKLLVTSRAPVHVVGEHERLVSPLALPPPDARLSAADVMAFDAVRLFVERSQAARPDFAFYGEEAAAVAAICRRLDGLPLAIELAAVWSKILPPTALLRQLEQRLPLLTGGPRDQPPRLRTMHDAIAWSHDLLSPGEQALFRRLAVFAGGFTLEAAASVMPLDERQEGMGASAGREPSGSDDRGGSGCRPSPETLTLLAALVDKNLVRRHGQTEGQPRFSMLETVREYALGQLAAAGESAAAQRAHAVWHRDLAAEAEPRLHGSERVAWLRRLDAEQDNFRAALTWSRAAGDGMALEMAGSLWWHWFHRGHWSEGRAWLESTLSQTRNEAATASARAKALLAAGMLAWAQGDYDVARERLVRSVALWRAVGDRRRLGYALGFLSETALAQGDLAASSDLAAESLDLFGAEDDRWGLGFALINAGNEARARGDERAAAARYEVAVAVLREAGDDWLLALPLRNLARFARRRGDLARAEALLRDSLTLLREPEERWYISRCFEELAAVAAARGDDRRAARLLGAAEAQREAIGAPVLPHYRADYERTLATGRARLGEEAFAAAWTEGCGLPLAEAVVEALAAERPERRGRLTERVEGGVLNLTRREREVLRLLAAGHTDRESAAILCISPRTVERHVTNIVNKLGLPSRLAAVVYAARHGLV